MEEAEYEKSLYTSHIGSVMCCDSLFSIPNNKSMRLLSQRHFLVSKRLWLIYDGVFLLMENLGFNPLTFWAEEDRAFVVHVSFGKTGAEFICRMKQIHAERMWLLLLNSLTSLPLCFKWLVFFRFYWLEGTISFYVGAKYVLINLIMLNFAELNCAISLIILFRFVSRA